MNGDHAATATHGYAYTKQHFKKARPMKVAIIGCGVSGIAATKMFKERFHNQPVELVIYEKNPSVGGTWFENVYPGYATPGPVPPLVLLPQADVRAAAPVTCPHTPILLPGRVIHTGLEST